jgi:hypothetical protein
MSDGAFLVSPKGGEVGGDKQNIMSSLGVKPKDLVDAELIHDILVRESRRDRIRAMGEEDTFSEEEKDWLELDRILSPHVFGKEERSAPARARDGHDLLNSIIPHHIDGIAETSQLSPQKLKEKSSQYPLPQDKNNRHGDMYQEMRWRYEDGEIVFDDAWKCPFTRAQLLSIRGAACFCMIKITYSYT